MTGTPEITLFTKAGGPLTKRISLDDAGQIKSDGSACVMSRGKAMRAAVRDLSGLARLIGGLRPDQAIGLGRLRGDLPDEVEIVTKSKLNGDPNVIARTSEFIGFQQREQAFALLDYDTKGMPPEIRAALNERGGKSAARPVPRRPRDPVLDQRRALPRGHRRKASRL